MGNEVIEGTVEEAAPQQAMTVHANPYLGMVQTMIERGGDLAKLDQILDLQLKWEANEARKAYTAAVAAFKANPPQVYKDKTNNQYGSGYTSIGNMVNTVSAAMGPHGLSASWETSQDNQIAVTCILTHVMGHSERVTLKGPPDKSGAKNDLQQIKSTLTYLKLATFEAVTGIASAEGNLDDDGNASGKPQGSARQAQSSGGSGKPMDGVWEAQSDESQKFLLGLAKEVEERTANDPADAVDYIAGQNLDTDEKAALWSRLPSKVRTALTKATKAASEAKA